MPYPDPRLESRSREVDSTAPQKESALGQGGEEDTEHRVTFPVCFRIREPKAPTGAYLQDATFQQSPVVFRLKVQIP